ncbi:DoxX family protein [Streptomyces liangshanensis]|uniref:DoxX family protein n=1 Tax=Streptomyces liangshanensis TaxID=2717324 RepID=A0A6G9GXC7_9ACTN|nr:DoxX family protein [Streptomyces liangshanensis]QIQ02933.1 DoxX family protein [Streptomyces liangshanensis]
MFIAYAVVGLLLVLGLTLSAFGTFRRDEKVVAGMREVGVPDSWLPRLATLKLLGALGLVAGLWVPLIGAAAAVGVLLYFIGAVVSHLRVKNHEIAPAGVFVVLAVAALVLRLASA